MSNSQNLLNSTKPYSNYLALATQNLLYYSIYKLKLTNIQDLSYLKKELLHAHGCATWVSVIGIRSCIIFSYHYSTNFFIENLTMSTYIFFPSFLLFFFKICLWLREYWKNKNNPHPLLTITIILAAPIKCLDFFGFDQLLFI